MCIRDRTKDSNGIAYVKFATLVNTGAGSKVPGASNDKLYAYLTSDSYQADVDGEKKAAYDVWTGSENVTLYEDVSSRNISAGSVIEYSEDGKYIDNVAVVGAYKDTVASLNNAANINVAAITGFDNGTVAYRDKTNAKKCIRDRIWMTIAYSSQLTTIRPRVWKALRTP